MDVFQQGYIPIITDSAIRSLLEDETPAYTTCGSHNSNLILNKIFEYASKPEAEIPGFKKAFEEFQKFCSAANSRRSRENKKCAKCFNDYTRDKTPYPEDAKRIAQLSTPNWESLSEEEKKNIIDKVDRYLCPKRYNGVCIMKKLDIRFVTKKWDFSFGFHNMG